MAKKNPGDQVNLEVEAKVWNGDGPLRLRTELATATQEGGGDNRKIEISLCASGGHIYVMRGGSQVAIPLQGLLSAAVEVMKP